MQNTEKILVLVKEIEKTSNELRTKMKTEKDNQNKIGELLNTYVSFALERDEGVDDYCVEAIELCASCISEVLQAVRKKNTKIEEILNKLKTLMRESS